MNDLMKLWNKMRLWVIGGLFIVILLLEVLAWFFPVFFNFLDRRGYIFIQLALLGVFLDVEHSIKTTNKATLETTNNFISNLKESNILNLSLKGPYNFFDGLPTVLDKAIEKDSKITSIDIFAETASTYYEYISGSSYKIENIRILVANTDILKKHQISPPNHNNWQSLKRDYHKVKQINIKTFDFLATFFFAIINKKYAHLGIYKLLPDPPGYTTYEDTYTIIDNEPVSTALLSNLKDFFDNAYNETYFSKDIGDNKI
jgi:hypothetical protein